MHTTKYSPKPTLRLYWGENYAPKPAGARKAIKMAFEEAEKKINLYPGGIQNLVKQRLSLKYKISKKSILIGSGVEDLLVTIFAKFIKSGDEVIIFDPTFSGYQHMIEQYDGIIINIPVKLYLKLTAKDILSKVTSKTKVICLASPNTTTSGYHLDLFNLKTIIKNFPGLVIIDECYYLKGNLTVLPMIKQFSNLMVLRSASKIWGLAGIRVGFAFSSPKNIKLLESVSLSLAPDPLPTVSYLALIQILPYTDSLEKNFVRFKNEFVQRLKKLPSIEIYDSYSTFIPVTIEKGSVKDLIDGMKKQGYSLRDTAKLKYLLIGIPPKSEWDRFIKVLKNCINLW